jgi:hypothetical protein
MPSEAAIATFLDELYDAAIFPERWPDAVAGFRTLLMDDIGNVVSHMNVIDLATGTPSHNLICGADPELVRQGTDYYFQQDIWVEASYQRATQALRQGQQSLALFSNEITDPEHFKSTEFYQDFLGRFGVVDMMCTASLVDQSKMLSLVVNPVHSRPLERRDK